MKHVPIWVLLVFVPMIAACTPAGPEEGVQKLVATSTVVAEPILPKYSAIVEPMYEIFFHNLQPEPGKVYIVLYAELVPLEGHENTGEHVCNVGLKELPNENASMYDSVIDWHTAYRAVVFLPESELPLDAVEFEASFTCFNYDNIQEA